MGDVTLETNVLNFLTDYITRTALQKESGLYAASCAISLRGLSIGQIFRIQHHTQDNSSPFGDFLQNSYFGMFSLLDDWSFAFHAIDFAIQ